MSQNLTAGGKSRRGRNAAYGAFEHRDGVVADTLGDMLDIR